LSLTDDLDMDKLKSGDEDAFRDLVLAFKDQVYNLCYGFVGSEHDAEDVAQEVFLEVYRSIALFRGDAKLSTYIYRIAVTKSLQHLRKRKRKAWLSFFRDKGEKIPGEEEAADEALDRKRRMKILAEGMDKLAENQRIALGLYCFEGLSYKEIAEVMEVSISSVESLIFRARGRLRKFIGDRFSKGAPKDTRFLGNRHLKK
jgi:RNA polymerase sigma factor (sigma-70 family)